MGTECPTGRWAQRPLLLALRLVSQPPPLTKFRPLVSLPVLPLPIPTLPHNPRQLSPPPVQTPPNPSPKLLPIPDLVLPRLVQGLPQVSPKAVPLLRLPTLKRPACMLLLLVPVQWRLLAKV